VALLFTYFFFLFDDGLDTNCDGMIFSKHSEEI